MNSKKEGDAVGGKVTKKIKGGLLVDIGVPVVLSASRVESRRRGEISDLSGRQIDAVILKIDEERRKIVISRRKLIEQQREEQKRKTLDGLTIGEVKKGIVKNIADFGAFIDLGGIDGLLHITDMSWGRINHPSDILKIDQEIEVKVLQIDKDKEKIALGLKQKDASPWENIESKYPAGSVHDAEVVNIMSYGAFCKLEEGVEGLVHISEMSWTKRINHPSEVVAQGQKVKVKVLEINKEKQEISLGMKQVEENPWERVAEKYPPGSLVTGKVRNIANYGAFVEIEEGIDGLLHVSDLSWTKKIGHPSEILKKGEEVQAVVLSVDQEKQRIALGLKQTQGDALLFLIDAEDDGLHFLALLEDFGGVADLFRPGEVGDVEEAVDAFFDLDEGAVVGDVADLAGDERSGRVFFGDALPGVFLDLLHAEGDLLLLFVDLQDFDLDLLALGDDLGGMIDALGPGHLGDMDEAFDALFELAEGAIGHDVDDLGVVDGA